MVSQLKVNEIVQQSGSNLTLGGSGDNIVLGSGATTSIGKIGQVIQATKTDSQTFALATDSYSDVTGLSLNITPSSSSSKVLVEYRMHVGRQSTNPAPYSYLLRDSSIIFQGDASGSRKRATATYGNIGGTETNAIHTQIFLDSPASTSQLTYKIQVGGFSSRTFYVNIPNVDSAETYSATSTITAMEVLP